MGQYAASLTTCRHSQVLAHFGAALSALQPCNSACDNCVLKHKQSAVNVTATARHIVELFNSEPVREAGGAQNIKEIINPLCGSAGRQVLPYKERLGNLYGADKKVPRKTVNAVFGTSLAHGVLRGLPVAQHGKLEWRTALRYSVRSFFFQFR